MLGGFLFVFWRICQIVTLLPIIGMLAWFVDGYNRAGQLTPVSILILFIVAVLACAWALATVLRLSSTRRSSKFVAFIDICFVGAFIAGVYHLRGIAGTNCVDLDSGSISVDLGVLGYYGYQNDNGSQWTANFDKKCAMLKASWAFGIMNTIFFFVTAILAILLKGHQKDSREKSTRRSRHSSRRGHSTSSNRRHSSSGRRYYV